MEEGEINDIAGEEVLMEDIDYANKKYQVIKPKKRIAGETGRELSIDEELRAKFNTVKTHKIQRNLQKMA